MPAAALLLVLGLTAAHAHQPLQDDIDRARERIASSSDPANEILTRGELHRLAGDFAAARADYERAALLDPNLAGLELCRAALLVDEARWNEAKAALDHLIEHDPSDARALKLRAEVLEALDQPGEAATDLERAIERMRHPQPDLFTDHARLLMAAGRELDAVRTLDQGIARLGPIVGLELAAAALEDKLGSGADAEVRRDRVAEQIRRARVAGVIADTWPRPMASSSRPMQAIPAVDPVVTRGPYLQIGTPNDITIRWRTDSATTSRVLYGTALGSLTQVLEDATPTTEHEITLTGLGPDTRYYYAIGSTTSLLEGGDEQHTFVTAPNPGTEKPTRIWIIGDAGTGTAAQARVRDAFVGYTGSRPTDVWLMLGDNAYSSGTDGEYQRAVFDMYETQLKHTVLWPTRGNHELLRSAPRVDYYDIFSMPIAGEAGGLPSGTEAYYSFDHGNIHFICLDSQGTSRSPTGAMATWLRNDIAATSADWVIAYWHHPPYSKGSHDSDDDLDSNGRLRDMRENILPILEAEGVDLVLTGHSHSYERSFLLDGHYGKSSTLTEVMKLDGGDGREDGDGPYQKATLGTAAHEGAVYTVAGSSGKTTSGPLDHPAKFYSVQALGSMVVDVHANRLDAVFIDDYGTVLDRFTMIKGVGGGTPPQGTFAPVADARVQSDAPTRNYGAGTGTAPLLRARSTGPTVNSFLKFDVRGLDGSVTSAKLRMYCVDASVDGGAVHLVSNDYQGTLDPWLESGLIWDNAPAIAGAPLDRKDAVEDSAWVEFDVTPAITGEGTFSFALTSGSTNIAGYESKEGANPPQLVIQVRSGGIGPVADARVQSDSPTRNFGTGTGTAPLLRVRSTEPTVYSYLKFEVAGLARPITRARLRLYCVDASVDGGAVYSVANDYVGTSDPWSESGLNWNNAPAIIGTPLDQRGAVEADTWVEFDVTPAITGDGTYSFGMTSGSTNIAGYSSRESLTPPELVIDTGANTMPTSARPDLQPARSFALGPAHPNPFRDQTTFRFDLPRAERVRLEVFDVMGRRVRVLAQGSLAPGAHEYSWDGSTDAGLRVDAGIYVIRLETAGVSTRKRVALVR